MPFPDGTNDEKEDISPPLECKTKDDIRSVVLHGNHASPPCIKIKLYLIHYGVPFELSTKKAGGDYKKVPVLKINDRQVNDSFIILKNLVPILCDEEFAEEWQRKITFELQNSIEAESFGDTPGDMKRYATKLAGIPGCIACCIAGPFGRKIAKKIRANNPNLRPSVEVGKEFVAAMESKQFFGGDKPGQIDMAYYGTLLGFKTAGCQAVENHLQDAGLSEWYGRMASAMPDAMAKKSKYP